MEALKPVRLLFLSILLMFLAGCVSGDKRVEILYQPGANYKGASGDLYLARAVPPASAAGAPSVQFILGEISNKDGAKIGNVVSDRDPVDMVIDALTNEFRNAGYNVIVVGTLPAGVKKGVLLANASFTLDEVKKWYRFEAKGRVKISVEPWRNGNALNRLDYEASYADSAITDRESLPQKTLEKALQDLMARSVPEVIKMIEQKQPEQRPNEKG